MLALQLIGLAGVVLLIASMVSGSRIPSDTAWARSASARRTAPSARRRSADRQERF